MSRDVSDDLLLTDDEVLALAVRDERTWPSPIPTVTSDDDLLASITRGQRSLAVRRLLLAEEVDAAVDVVVRGVLGGDVIFRLMLATADGSISGLGAVTTAYRAERACVLEQTSPLGIHRFTVMGEAHCFELAMAALAEVADHGLEVEGASDDDLPVAAVVTVGEGGDGAAVVARQGQVSLMTSHDQDFGKPVESVREGIRRALGDQGETGFDTTRLEV